MYINPWENIFKKKSKKTILYDSNLWKETVEQYIFKLNKIRLQANNLTFFILER